MVVAPADGFREAARFCSIGVLAAYLIAWMAGKLVALALTTAWCGNNGRIVARVQGRCHRIGQDTSSIEFRRETQKGC